MPPYFAYGSNLNAADMQMRCPSASRIDSARLEGWALTFRGVADIELAQGRCVLGALWDVSDSDVCSLDRYEGAPLLYAQQIVEVETYDGPREAMAYVMVDRAYRGLPSDWYLGRIDQGYLDWDLPRSELFSAVAETRAELEAEGIERFQPDGRKRLRAV